MQKYPFNCYEGAKTSYVNFLEQNCSSKFRNGAKMSITVIFSDFFTYHPLSRHHHTRANKHINLPHVFVIDESIENNALKVKKITVMDIFAPVLKFDGQFCSKKFYVGILVPS